MESIAACLAANLKRIRKEKKLTQGELAKRARISVIFLQGIETERKWLSPSTAHALAKALNISESKLFENCFAEAAKPRARKRLTRIHLDHIPDDIFNALATTCREPSWKWEVLRWLIVGFERERSVARS